MNIPDEAVHAALDSWMPVGTHDFEMYADMRAALTAALPHLQLDYEVKKLEWAQIHACNGILSAKTNFGTYFIGSNKTVRLGLKTLTRPFQLLDEAKSAAQADYERRVRECITTKPVDVAAVRRQTLEEAACRLDAKYEEAIIRSENCSDDMYDEFHDDAQHFKQSAAIVRALSAEPSLKGQQHDN